MMKLNYGLKKNNSNSTLNLNFLNELLEQSKIFKSLGFKRINDDLKRLGYKYIKVARKNII